MWYEMVSKDLKVARETGQPWHVLAAILRRTLDSLHPSEHGNLLRLAARETELSDLMLRRYLGAFARLGEIETEVGLTPGSLLSATFAPVELSLRLYSRDADAGLRALAALKQRKITLRELRRRLEGSVPSEPDVAARQRSNRERGILVGRCEELVSSEAVVLFGPGAFADRRQSTKYFRRVGFEFRTSASDVLGGGDLYLSESGGRDPLEGLAQSLLLASYLPAFYLIIGPDLDTEEADRASDALDALEAGSTGVLLLRYELPTLVVRRATPDPARARVERYRDLLLRFASGRNTARRPTADKA